MIIGVERFADGIDLGDPFLFQDAQELFINHFIAVDEGFHIICHLVLRDLQGPFEIIDDRQDATDDVHLDDF